MGHVGERPLSPLKPVRLHDLLQHPRGAPPSKGRFALFGNPNPLHRDLFVRGRFRAIRDETVKSLPRRKLGHGGGLLGQLKAIVIDRIEVAPSLIACNAVDLHVDGASDIERPRAAMVMQVS